MTTLYDVLKVAPTATEKEIKQAWRVMVRRYHPDTSGDAKSMGDFERVQHAYEVLSDVERRLEYDRRTFGYSHAGLAALKAHIRRSRKPDPRSGDDIRIVTNVPFEVMITGGQVAVSGTRLRSCAICDGWCTADGRAPLVCPTCDSEGVTRVRREDGKAVIRSCGHCGGRGVLIEEGCEVCVAAGRLPEPFEQEVTIPAGVRSGMSIRIGPGHDGIFGGKAGDLYVSPDVEPHTYYRRDGDDLHITVMVNPLAALVGGEVPLPPIVDVEMPMVVYPPFVCEHVLLLEGRGIGEGALIITLRMDDASTLSDTLQDEVRQLVKPETTRYLRRS
jgi:molecular chaperone DnaJ